MKHTITQKQICSFREHLLREERSHNTIEKYLHEIRSFYEWLDGSTVTKERVTRWKEYLSANGKAPVTVNGSLAALHNFFAFLRWTDCRGKYLKIQRQVFRDASRELTREEFIKLVHTAEAQRNRRLALLLETICATGIRVSEVKYITLEASRRGRADISLKGKIRTILIPADWRKNCKNTLRNKKSPPARFFSPKAERACPGGRYGLK